MMQDNCVIETFSSGETYEYARQIGENAKGGQIYLLSGDLGTGKTVWASGMAAGLGIDDYINSPTFTIMQIYEGGRLPLYHYDVYRIGDVSEMDELGYEEYFYGDGVTIIEWPELIEEILPDDCITVKLEKDLEKGFDYRKITLKGKKCL